MGNSGSMSSRARRGWLVVFVLVGSLVFVAAADASVISSAGGNAFSGTYTNDTGVTVNTIGIKADTNPGHQGENPIASFTFDGWKCQPDTYIQTTGEYFCGDSEHGTQGSGTPLAPGASASFDGTTKDAVTPGETFTICAFEAKTYC